MAALWTEVCLVHPVLDAMAEGFEVYPVVDACAGASLEAHRDWNRVATAPGFADILFAIKSH